MKKLMRILLISFVLLLAVPVYAKADPPGYKIVKLTKKNVKKYFSLKKVKNEYGDHSVYLYSKLRKKGYFIAGGDFIIKGTYRHRYKKGHYVRYETVKFDVRCDERLSFADCPYINPVDDFDYSYKGAKISDIKFKKAKGIVIFAEPTNVSSIIIDDYYDFVSVARRTRIIKLLYDLPEQYQYCSDVVYDQYRKCFCIERNSFVDNIYNFNLL